MTNRIKKIYDQLKHLDDSDCTTGPPMDMPEKPAPQADRWEVGKNGWDATDEMTREDI